MHKMFQGTNKHKKLYSKSFDIPLCSGFHCFLLHNHPILPSLLKLNKQVMANAGIIKRVMLPHLHFTPPPFADLFIRLVPHQQFLFLRAPNHHAIVRKKHKGAVQ